MIARLFAGGYEPRHAKQRGPGTATGRTDPKYKLAEPTTEDQS